VRGIDFDRTPELDSLTIFQTATVGVINFWQCGPRSLTDSRAALDQLLGQFKFGLVLVLARQTAFDAGFEEQEAENALLHRKKCAQSEPNQTGNGGRTANRSV